MQISLFEGFISQLFIEIYWNASFIFNDKASLMRQGDWLNLDFILDNIISALSQTVGKDLINVVEKWYNMLSIPTIT